MTTVRVAKRDRFTLIDRRTANDSRLSFKARGILLWLLDKPDDWETTAEKIEQQGKEGREAIRSALKELEQFGYLTRIQWRDEHMRFQTEWTISEEGNSGSPYTGFRSRKAAAGKPYPLIDTETNTKNSGVQKSESPGARFPQPRSGCDVCAGGWREDENGNAYACGCEVGVRHG